MNRRMNPNTNQCATAGGGVVLWVCCALVAVSVAAETVEPSLRPIDELEGVGVTEKLGQTVPLDATFIDERGRTIRLGDSFIADRPVILNLGYHGCPMLCGLVTQGMLEAMRELSMTPGVDYLAINVSIDATETHELAALKKRNWIEALGLQDADDGVRFLTGEREQIAALAEAVGFDFRWNPQAREYMHAAVIILLTPEGVVSRYLYGVQYPPRTMRLSLVEASEGKVGSMMDQLLLFCFHYNPDKGYTLAAVNLMRFAGAMTVLLLVVAIGTALIRESLRRQAGERAAAAAAEPVR